MNIKQHRKVKSKTQSKGKGNGKSGAKRKDIKRVKEKSSKSIRKVAGSGDKTHEGEDMNAISSHIHHF